MVGVRILYLYPYKNIVFLLMNRHYTLSIVHLVFLFSFSSSYPFYLILLYFFDTLDHQCTLCFYSTRNVFWYTKTCGSYLLVPINPKDNQPTLCILFLDERKACCMKGVCWKDNVGWYDEGGKIRVVHESGWVDFRPSPNLTRQHRVEGRGAQNRLTALIG